MREACDSVQPNPAVSAACDSAQDDRLQKAPIWFWILASILVVYVAVCTGQRENKMGADAWEHLRVLRALTENLWHPGNPTFASDLPSVRYSPYMVAVAALCVKLHMDPYDALSCAAVLNTALLAVSLWRPLAIREFVLIKND
jgi:hypothetical protein